MIVSRSSHDHQHHQHHHVRVGGGCLAFRVCPCDVACRATLVDAGDSRRLRAWLIAPPIRRSFSLIACLRVCFLFVGPVHLALGTLGYST